MDQQTAYMDLDGKTGQPLCIVFIIIGVILAAAGGIVGVIFGIIKHYQLFLTAFAVLTVLLPMIYLGMMHKKGKAERRYVWVMGFMIIPLLFGCLSIFTSVNISTDNYVKCAGILNETTKQKSFYHHKYKQCISCPVNNCISYDFLIRGNNPICSNPLVTEKDNKTKTPLCSTAPRPRMKLV
ncbi:hypothetical protein BLNAU_2681 [Blattamonas nauphoetae]|uniref:Uncharacterized protein n=1 Tax=Blattamonas nauphoetae TaxID=2049346 RepID=A0ABQ9YFF6_9EUKA|nr:hypothetical protein BLNAU_2681 [Blattamonas nauphoetae]